MADVSEAEFEAMVGDAMDLIPDELFEQMSNVVVTVEDEPPPGSRLLGLYQGRPLTSRGNSYGIGGATPDRITIYRGPICRSRVSTEGVREQVRTTVLHEIAHHFGISDEHLREIGRY